MNSLRNFIHLILSLVSAWSLAQAQLRISPHVSSAKKAQLEQFSIFQRWCLLHPTKPFALQQKV